MSKDGLAVSEQSTNAELLFISRVAYNKKLNKTKKIFKK